MLVILSGRIIVHRGLCENSLIRLVRDNQLGWSIDERTYSKPS